MINAQEKIRNNELSLSERLKIMSQSAKDLSIPARDLVVIEHHIQEEIDIRFARVAQYAMRSARSGFISAHTTFKDVPVAKDIKFDIELLQAIHGGMVLRLEEEGVTVQKLTDPEVVYTAPPDPGWEFWSEIDHLRTDIDVTW